MADFTALKTAIRDAIKQNGNEEITGVVLQEILLSMVSTLGEDAINALSAALTAAITSLTNDIGDVSSAVQSAVSDLNHSLNTEAQTRAYQDTQLQNGIYAEAAGRQAQISELRHDLNVEAQTRAYGDLNEASIRQTADERLELRINGLSIDFDDLLEDVRKLIRNYNPIVINGNVTNAPDEQDLTTTPNNLLKLKDNSYNPIVFSGMGKKFLRKNLRPLSESYDFDGFVDDVTTQAELLDYPELIFWDRINEHFVGLKNGVYYLAWTDDDAFVPASTSNLYMYGGEPYRWNGTDFYVDDEDLPNVRNLLTQDMINEANTIYIIRYDYTLIENITIPANCILEFDGGSVSGAYTITGANTNIEAGLVKIFSTDVALAGTWNIVEAYPQWFGLIPNDNTKDCSSFLKMMCLLSINTFWSKGKWYFSPTCIYGATNFKIRGEHNGVDSFSTTFKLLPNSNNAHYILKLGGKPDFSYVDDYDAYAVKRFSIDGIYFQENKSDNITNLSETAGEYLMGCLVLDNCASGYLKIGFNPYQVALLMRTCWELIFEHIIIYYDTIRDSDNLGIPKINFGKPNSVGSGGTNINACIFHDIMAENINGPILSSEKDAYGTHIIFNNITLENYPFRAEGETSVSEMDYKKAIDGILANGNYVIRPIIDLSKVSSAFSFITINNISTDWIDNQGVLTSDDKYVITPILSYNGKNNVIINNVDITAGFFAAFYFNGTNGDGEVKVGSVNCRSGYINEYCLATQVVLLSEDYSKNLHIDFLDDTLLINKTSDFNGVLFRPSRYNILQLNKLYEGNDISKILYLYYNSFSKSNIVNSGIINGVWTSDRDLFKVYCKDVPIKFKLVKGLAQTMTIICYSDLDLTGNTLGFDRFHYDGSGNFVWDVTLSKTVTQFGSNGYIIKVSVPAYTNDGNLFQMVTPASGIIYLESIKVEPNIEE